jgi:AcrR family transcriptional regulator
MNRTVAPTRARLLRAGEQLFRIQGYAATSLKQLSAAAEAPWGSIYHHFPGGKEELGVAVVAYAGEIYGGGWRAAFERFEDPGEAIEWVFVAQAKLLEASDYRNGCPVASVTLDTASVREDLRLACHRAFTGWLDVITDGLVAAGAPLAQAKALSVFVLSAIEGAIVVSRAAKSPDPLLHSAGLVRWTIDEDARTWGNPAD